MAKFSVPKSPSKSTYTMSTFQGCDFTNSPATVDETKSPNCINMVRDVPGKIRKSMGYKVVKEYANKAINGSHYLRSSDEQIIHAGNQLICGNLILYKAAANHRSKSWQFGDRLFIQDGTNLLVYYKEMSEEGEEYWGEHTVTSSNGEFDIIIERNNSGDKVYFSFSSNIISATASGTSLSVSGKFFNYTFDGLPTRFRIKTEESYSISTRTLSSDYSQTLYNNSYISSQTTGILNLRYFNDLSFYDKVEDFNGTWKYEGDDHVYLTFTPATIWTSTESLTVNTSVGSGHYHYRREFTDDNCYSISVNDNSKIAQIYIETANGKTVTLNSKTEADKWSYTAPFKDRISLFVIVTTAKVTLTSYIKYATYLNQEYTITRYNHLSNTCWWNRQRQADPSGFIDATDGNYVDSKGQIPHVKKLSEIAYIPTVTEGKLATGGGTSYEPLNLLQPYFIETFYGSHPEQSGETVVEVEDSDFKMSFAPLDSAAHASVMAWRLNSNGEWGELRENQDFSVDRTSGIIHFNTKPGRSPIDGTPNVKIQAPRTVEGYADKINKCTISIPFGVNGNGDRLFVSGNPDYYNQDWWCQKDDPTYWGDTWYSSLGSPSSKIVGYSIISNYLAAHKDDYEKDANIILREGNFVDNDAVFPIVASLQGAGAIAPWSFSYLETEPVFLTKRGIYAVTAQDITGEKYSQNRSYYLDGKLLEENNLENAYACIYNDFYILALNSHLYILDGLQPVHTDKSMPYATRQYAGFYRENVPATCMWTFNDELYFGTEDGKVCKFYKDKYALESYNDNGAAIECVWESPDLDGRQFFKNKTFRYLAIRLDSAISTSINVYAMKRGIWNFLKFDNKKARYFTFPTLDFSRFSFSTDETQKIIHTKIRLKKLDKARFRLTNTNVNEPFGLYDVALEYIENGNYKG